MWGLPMAFSSKVKIFVSVSVLAILNATAWAGDIPYRSEVELKVGQSAILKGVRGQCNDKRAPRFSSLNRLPKPKTGRLSDGGRGTVESDSCGKTVPARAIKFTATKKGSERLTIYKDRIKITVN